LKPHRTISSDPSPEAAVPDAVPVSAGRAYEFREILDRRFARELKLPALEDDEKTSVPNDLLQAMRMARSNRFEPAEGGIRRLGAGTLEQVYPGSYAEPLALSEGGSSYAITPMWTGAGACEVVDGAIFYPEVAPGVDVARFGAPDRTEEFLLIRGPEALKEIRYRIDVPREIVEMREIGGFWEWRDGAGTPRLRLHPVVAVDAEGRVVAAE
jgi:hypothetical protein